jgi:hypothetical protein
MTRTVNLTGRGYNKFIVELDQEIAALEGMSKGWEVQP